MVFDMVFSFIKLRRSARSHPSQTAVAEEVVMATIMERKKLAMEFPSRERKRDRQR